MRPGVPKLGEAFIRSSAIRFRIAVSSFFIVLFCLVCKRKGVVGHSRQKEDGRNTLYASKRDTYSILPASQGCAHRFSSPLLTLRKGGVSCLPTKAACSSMHHDVGQTDRVFCYRRNVRSRTKRKTETT
jgi:hypothetical protein